MQIIRVVAAVVALGSLSSLASSVTPLSAQSSPSAAGERKPAPGSIVDLGTLGHDVSVAWAINRKRQVVGSILDTFENFQEAFLWEDGVMRQLSGPDLEFVTARDINDRGQIAGFGTDLRTIALIGLRWEEDGTVTRLATPPGDSQCVTEAINGRGDVVGSCWTPVSNGLRSHGVLWRNGEVVDLGSVPGAGDPTPLAINDRGVVLGFFLMPEGLNGGSFVWKDGVFTRLPADLMAADINDRGQIAGRRQLSPELRFEAVVLDRGTIIPLPSPSIPGFVSCSAAAINQQAVAAGSCTSFGTVWVRGQPRVLPGLATFVGNVTDLNDRGDVVGFAAAADENFHAVLWPRAATHDPDTAID